MSNNRRNNQKKSQQTRGKSSAEIQRQKNKANNRRIQQKQVVHQPHVETNFSDSEDDLWHTDHSAYVWKNMKGIGAPSFGMCHDEYGILDAELWKEAQCEDNWR